eukprot:32922-Alexandrium_andersonii.AAC.1
MRRVRSCFGARPVRQRRTHAPLPAHGVLHGGDDVLVGAIVDSRAQASQLEVMPNKLVKNKA